MTIHTSYAAVLPFITKDGSEIRELMNPQQHHNKNQSLAEATLPPNTTTHKHQHPVSEEIYHFTSGKGIMTLGEERFEVQAGDSVCIPPGTAHQLENPHAMPLVLLCMCAPAYSHDDTEILP